MFSQTEERGLLKESWANIARFSPTSAVAVLNLKCLERAVCLACDNCGLLHKELFTCLFKGWRSSTQYAEPLSGESSQEHAFDHDQQRHLRWWVTAAAASESWSSVYLKFIKIKTYHVSKSHQIWQCASWGLEQYTCQVWSQ